MNLDEFKPRPIGRPCEFGQYVAKLSDERREALEYVMDKASGYSTPVINDTITGWFGRRFSSSTIRKHRNGDCVSCSRVKSE